MRKRYRETALFRAIAGVTAASVIGLSVSTSALAFDSNWDGNSTSGQVVGFSITGDLDFNNISVMGFAHKPINSMSGSSTGTVGSFFSIDNGVAKTQLPLFTFGETIKYPGILYNQTGNQFFDHVARAAEGDTESQTVIWPYVVGGVVIIGGAIALASGSSDDDPAPATTTPTTTTTSSSSSSSSPTSSSSSSSSSPSTTSSSSSSSSSSSGSSGSSGGAAPAAPAGSSSGINETDL